MTNHERAIKALSTMLLWAVAALAAASAAWAQSTELRRIAVLTPGLTFEPIFHGLKDGLARLGYIDGKNIAFIVEDTQESNTDLTSRARKLLAAKPDILFAVTTAHALAAKESTSTTPIIFSWVRDPVQAGLVASFPSSKNNLTGVMTGADNLSGKRLEILLDMAPRVRRVLALVAAKETIALSSFGFLDEAARKVGVQLIRRDVANEEEIKKLLRETPRGSVDAIYHVPSTFLASHLGLLIEKAKADKIPIIVHEEGIVEKGALLSYGANFRSVGVQSARLVGKVLKGGAPSEIPSEVPDKLMLVINRATARTIGFDIPRKFMERADRIVE